MYWLILIGGLLGIGFIVDFVAKKHSINIDPDEGAKNASDSERIYVESYLHNMRNDNNNGGFL